MAMAGSDSTTTPSFILSNISNLVSIKLYHHNYLLWRSLFEPLLISHDLMGFVNGSHPCLEKSMQNDGKKVTSNILPKYTAWIRQDQNLLSWIRATLSKNVLSQFVGLRTSHDG